MMNYYKLMAGERFIMLLLLYIFILMNGVYTVWPPARVISIVGFTSYLLLRTIFFNIKIEKHILKNLVMPLLLFFFMLISAFLNGDYNLLYNAILLLLVFLGCALLVNLNQITVKEIINISLLAYTTILIASLYSSNMEIYLSFKGIFDNPNMMGITLTVLSILLLIKIQNGFVGKNIYKIILWGSFLVFVEYVLMMTRSRSSFFISIFFIGVIILKNIFSLNLRDVKNIFLFFIFFLVTYFVLINFDLKEVLNDTIIKKSITKSDDLLDFRKSIWATIYSEINLFGHGYKYIESKMQLGGHNTYMIMLSEYGIISTLIFLYVTLKSWWKSFLFKNYSWYFLLFSTFFVLSSMVEGNLFKYSMIVTVVSLFTNCERKIK